MAVAVGEIRRRQEAMELLVSEIARGDDEDVPASIQIAVERGWTSGIVDTMVQAKAKKETEIDRICYRHYGDFLASVKEIVNMRKSAAELTTAVGELHEGFSSTGQELVRVLSELDKLNGERENIRRGLEMAEQCRDLAKLMFEARKQIMQEDHYAALHTIDKIQNDFRSVPISALADILGEWLPQAVAQILEGVRNEADDYMGAMRCMSANYGRILLHRQAQVSAAASKRGGKHGIVVGDRFSISLHHVRRYGNVFRLDKWAFGNEFEAVTPYIYALDDSDITLMNSFFEDLAPLHKALYTYTVLGRQNQFHSHYRAIRERELLSIVDGAAVAISKKKKLVDLFPNMVASLIGFFAIELMCTRSIDVADESHAHNGRSEPGAFSVVEIALLWDTVGQRIDEFLVANMADLSNPDEVLLIKEELLLMIETVADEAVGLKQHSLFETMRKLWARFADLQLEWISNECIMALEHSAYQPMQVNNETALVQSIRAYRLDSVQVGGDESDVGSGGTGTAGLAAANLDALEADFNSVVNSNEVISKVPFGGTSSNLESRSADDMASDGDNEGSDDDLGDVLQGGESLLEETHSSGSGNTNFVPLTFAFSAAVPQIMRALHVLVVRFFLFAHRNTHLSACGEAVCEAVFRAYEVLGSRLTQEIVVDGADTPLSKVCQISIDAATFAAVSDTVWEIIENGLNHFRWSESIHSHLPNAISNSKMYLNRIAGQAQDFVFELLTYKVDDLLASLWLNNFEIYSVPTHCHAEIEELVDFLSITFMGLTHLPASARETAHFTCCTRVAEEIMKYILSPKVARVTVYTFVAVNLDVQRLLRFVDECRVPHLKQCFSDLMDLVQLVLSSQFLFYVDNPQDRSRKYPRTDTAKLTVLFEKMVPVSEHWQGVNLDKAAIKSVAKKLKSQVRM